MAQLLKRTTFKATNSHQLSIVIVPVIMVMLATICVILRFRARYLQKSARGFDDWLCFAALLLTWAFQGVNMAAVFAGGAGLPIETVLAIDPTALVTYLKIIFVNFTLWVLTVSIVQLCILFFYIRLFGVSPMFRWACYVLVAMIAAFGTAGFFSEIFSCVPVSKSWEPLESGHCVASKPYCSSIGIIHVLFDLGILIIPLPMIWKLQMRVRSKVVLTFILCLGMIATIISLLKIVCLFDLTGISPDDITDYLWLTILLQTLELPIGIICCCVSTLKPAVIEIATGLNTMRSRLLSYTRSRNNTDKLHRTDPSNHGTDSITGFARLNDSLSHIENSKLGNQWSADAEAIELGPRKTTAHGTGKSIDVTNSYEVSYN